MEVYIDDMLVKSLIGKDHIRHLSECFETLKIRDETQSGKMHFQSHLGRVSRIYRDPARYRSKPKANLCSPRSTQSKDVSRNSAPYRQNGGPQPIHFQDRGEQHPVFYTSKRLTDAETRYPTLERIALAIVTSARKLRPYFQSHSIIVLTDLPLRTILQNANQSGRLSKWVIELSEYDITYKGRPTIKAQVLADFIIEIPPDQTSELEIPVKSWILHVDGASSNKGSGIGVHLQSPTGELIEQSF
ncbi:hypothetical protein N665_0097s0014 [Sinapis alba]|nr:hypothetical protein N665_0097s0014 [Sinapis alba]